MTPSLGIEPGATLVGGERSQHCAIPAGERKFTGWTCVTENSYKKTNQVIYKKRQNCMAMYKAFALKLSCLKSHAIILEIYKGFLGEKIYIHLTDKRFVLLTTFPVKHEIRLLEIVGIPPMAHFRINFIDELIFFLNVISPLGRCKFSFFFHKFAILRTLTWHRRPVLQFRYWKLLNCSCFRQANRYLKVAQ